MHYPTLLLRNLPILAKLGVAGLVLVFFMGLAASAMHIREHYQNRDERPGLTRDDITAAYAGLTAVSPILKAVQGDHPKTNVGDMVIKPEARATIEKWLGGEKVAENYDNIDFADPTPRDVLAAACVTCHSTKADAGKAGKATSRPLETWEQVKPLAFTRRIERTSDRVKTISTHTHALALGTMGVALLVLTMLSTWPRWLTGILIAAMGLGLCADISGWWLTNWYPGAVNLILGGGAAFNGASVLLLLLALFELLKPRRA